MNKPMTECRGAAPGGAGPLRLGLLVALALAIIAWQSPAVQAQKLGNQDITLTYDYANNRVTFSVDAPTGGGGMTSGWFYKLADAAGDCSSDSGYGNSQGTGSTYSGTITGNAGKYICILHRTSGSNPPTTGSAGPINYDITAPTVTAASVNGASLTVTFSEAMSSTKAADSAWAVSVAGSARSVSSYTLSGAGAILTLASAVTPGQTVTLGYTKPGSGGKLQDAAGNDLASFSSRAVSNATPPPAGAIEVTPAGTLKIAEGGTGTLMVRLSARPSADVTVTLSKTNSDVTLSGATLSNSALTFTAGNYSTAQTVTVTAGEDDNDYDDDTDTITFTASGGITASAVTKAVSITDNDAGLDLSMTSLTVEEDNTATFKVKLKTQPTAAVTVELSQPNNGTNADVKFTPTSLNFTTTNWGADQTVRVSAAGDDDAADDTATINLTAAGGDYQGKTARVMVEVDDDDEVKLDFSQSTVSVEEGSSATFTVRLDSIPSDDVKVTMTQPTNTEVTFRGGGELVFTTTNWYIPVSVVVDAAEDGDSAGDIATLNFSAEGGGYDGVTGRVTINVTDDDIGFDLNPTSLTVREGSTGSFTIKLKTRPAATVRVMLSQPGNTDVTVDRTELSFTTSNWNRVQTVTVRAADDPDTARDTGTIALGAEGGGYDSVSDIMVVTVNDDDEEALVLTPAASLTVREGASATFTVRLEALPSQGVSVMLAQSGTANADVNFSPASLTFTTSNWNSTQTVTVSAEHDDDVNLDRATITLTASGGSYAGVSKDLRITVADDDVVGLVLTPAALTVGEGGNNTFTVRLEALPRGDVMVALAQGGTANTDVSFAPASLDFTTANWKDPQTVTVSAKQDDDFAADMATIALTASGSNYAGVTGSLKVTVADDEDIALTLSTTALTLDEGDTATFTVKLASNSGGTRTVKLASDNADVTLSPTELMFAADEWDKAKTVTVTARHETDVDWEDDTANITFTGTGITAGSRLTVTVTDDDKGAPPEQEEGSATLQLATIAANLVPASSSTIALRFDTPRGARTATVAGRQVALDRSLIRDLAAGFADRTGAQGAAQERFAEGRFGAERHSGDWLGGVRLEDGRPLRTASGSASTASLSGPGALLSSFSYALGADGDAAGSAGWSVWGRVDTGEFSGTSDGVEFDGSQSSTWFGFDRRTDGGVLSGVAYSSSSSDSDYTLGKFGASIETDMTIVMPYMKIEDISGGGSGHIMLGLVDGDATLNQTNRLQGSADLSMYMLVAGGSWPAVELDNSTLSWSGDFGFSALKTSGSELTALDASVNNIQLRGGVELMHSGLGEGLRAMPRVGLLLRHDAGDGITGTGVELTGGMQMLGASERFSLDLNLRALLMHSAEDLSDWGAGLQLRFNSGSGGEGLAFAVGPHWGAAEDDLLDRDDAFRLDDADRQHRQVRGGDRGLAGNIGYGLRAFGGLLTPYSEYRFTSGSNGGARQLAGVRFSNSAALELRFFSERHIAHLGQTRSRLAVELQKRY